MTQALQDLVREHGAACANLTEWWKTGILPEGPLRDRANDPSAPWAEIHPGDPHQAERELIQNVIQAIAELHKRESES